MFFFSYVFKRLWFNGGYIYIYMYKERKKCVYEFESLLSKVKYFY